MSLRRWSLCMNRDWRDCKRGDRQEAEREPGGVHGGCPPHRSEARGVPDEVLRINEMWAIVLGLASNPRQNCHPLHGFERAGRYSRLATRVAAVWSRR